MAAQTNLISKDEDLTSETNIEYIELLLEIQMNGVSDFGKFYCWTF